MDDRVASIGDDVEDIVAVSILNLLEAGNLDRLGMDALSKLRFLGLCSYVLQGFLEVEIGQVATSNWWLASA